MVEKKFIYVQAKIRLLPTAEGGRTVPISGSYRPNHFFCPGDRNMTVGFVDIPEGEEVHPGESIEVPIQFWYWPGLEELIYPGQEWRIQEGARLVGIGTVLEILPTASATSSGRLE